MYVACHDTSFSEHLVSTSHQADLIYQHPKLYIHCTKAAEIGGALPQVPCTLGTLSSNSCCHPDYPGESCMLPHVSTPEPHTLALFTSRYAACRVCTRLWLMTGTWHNLITLAIRLCWTQDTALLASTSISMPTADSARAAHRSVATQLMTTNNSEHTENSQGFQLRILNLHLTLKMQQAAFLGHTPSLAHIRVVGFELHLMALQAVMLSLHLAQLCTML